MPLPRALVEPVSLTRDGISLVPLALSHESGIGAAASDGVLWNLPVTSVPRPGAVRAYIEAALATTDRFAWVVLDESGTVIGSTSFHDILPGPRRVEIGYTWYAKRAQRTRVNTTCKLMLLEHAFGVLACNTVGWRTDEENFASQAAIERLGAKKDGLIRGAKLRADGITVRGSVMYSLTADEWPAVRERLEAKLAAHA